MHGAVPACWQLHWWYKMPFSPATVSSPGLQRAPGRRPTTWGWRRTRRAGTPSAPSQDVPAAAGAAAAARTAAARPARPAAPRLRHSRAGAAHHEPDESSSSDTKGQLRHYMARHESPDHHAENCLVQRCSSLKVRVLGMCRYIKCVCGALRPLHKSKGACETKMGYAGGKTAVSCARRGRAGRTGSAARG